MERERSCVDCAATACRGNGKPYPDFCLTKQLDKTVLHDALDCYTEEENATVMRTAAEVENTGYCQWTRVQEIIEFAKRMGYCKLGVATCVGLIQESRLLGQILRAHGFEVYGVACKVGAVPKETLGIPKNCITRTGANSCNPILQAKLLNEAHTEFNIVVGLCVGHDSLFYKYSDALVTTLVTKDRVLGHNPVAALYTAGSYYKSLLQGEE